MTHATSWGIAASFSVLLLCSHALAQREPRLSQTRGVRSQPSPVATVNTDGKLDVYASLETTWVVDTQIGLPGQVHSWAATFDVPENFLVSGRASATGPGVIQHWRLTNPLVPPTLSSTRSVANQDFIAVAYDQAKLRIYALDFVSKTIEVASWNGTDALPTNGWTVIVNATQLPELATPARCSLGISRDRSGNTFLSIGLDQENLLPLLLNRRRDQIDIDDTFLPVTIHRIAPDSWNGNNYRLDALTLAEGRTSITLLIETTETAAFEVHDLATSTVIGTATAPGNADQLVIPLQQALSLGASYLVKRVSEPLMPMLGRECYARYGTPETTLNGIQIGRVHHAPFADVGSSFQMYADVYTESLALADIDGNVTVNGAFALAIRDPITGQDPVVSVGASYLLQTDLFVMGKGVIGTAPGHGMFLSDSVVIPDDPALIGRVFLHQAWVLDQNWYVSDILGGVMRSHQSAAASATTGNRRPTRRVLEGLLKAANPKIMRSTAIFQQAFLQRQRR